MLKKLQNLPEGKKKLILWIIIIILAIGLFYLLIKNFQKRMENLKGREQGEEFKIPSLKESIEKEFKELEMPKIEMPEIDQEKLEEFKEKLKEEQTR